MRKKNTSVLERQLYEASVRLFEEKGYRDTSIQDIVDSVGVTKGSFYYYFKDKEQVLYQIHDEFISYELAQARIAYQALRNPEEKLTQFIHDLLRSIAIYKAHVTIFFRERRYLGSDNMSKILEKRQEYESVLVRILEDGKQDGSFKIGHPKITALGIFGMCNWAYQWFRSNGELEISQIANEFVDMVLSGLKPNQG